MVGNGSGGWAIQIICGIIMPTRSNRRKIIQIVAVSSKFMQNWESSRNWLQSLFPKSWHDFSVDPFLWIHWSQKKSLHKPWLPSPKPGLRTQCSLSTIPTPWSNRKIGSWRSKENGGSKVFFMQLKWHTHVCIYIYNHMYRMGPPVINWFVNHSKPH